MSDEEKKAMDSLKVISEYAGDNYLAKEHRRKLKLLIELVEKQSKEIEELKKPKYLLNAKTGEITTINNSEFISKDKIKAKIEPKLKELDTQINEEWKKYGNSKELQDMEDMYNFLQSLLEKE